jgi:hypothetical protein
MAAPQEAGTENKEIFLLRKSVRSRERSGTRAYFPGCCKHILIKLNKCLLDGSEGKMRRATGFDSYYSTQAQTTWAWVEEHKKCETGSPSATGIGPGVKIIDRVLMGTVIIGIAMNVINQTGKLKGWW